MVHQSYDRRRPSPARLQPARGSATTSVQRAASDTTTSFKPDGSPCRRWRPCLRGELQPWRVAGTVFYFCYGQIFCYAPVAKLRRVVASYGDGRGGGDHAGGGQHRRGTVLQSTPWSYHGCNTEARQKAAMVNDLFVESGDGEHRQ
ncbi:hypothetical protein VPH35_008515 [Triticum aestivum]